MKKLFVLLFIPVLLLCGCTSEKSDTQFLMDTVCTVTADCNDEVLDGVFKLCENYERLLSRTKPESEISMINHYDELELSPETLEILVQAIYYCQKTGGKYDITITPATELYDFGEKIAPTEEEAKRKLYKVGYNRIEVKGNYVDLHNTDIDLDSIAKGYIADKAVEYLKQNGVKKGIVNLGGNIAVFGKTYKVEIPKPNSSETMLTVKIKNASAVTGSIYDRCFEKDGKLYHHILDVETGLPIENELASVTILGERSSECDVLSTVCMILGEEASQSFISQIEGYEAIFIKKDNSVSVSSGLKLKKNQVVYK